MFRARNVCVPEMPYLKDRNVQIVYSLLPRIYIDARFSELHDTFDWSRQLGGERSRAQYAALGQMRK